MLTCKSPRTVMRVAYHLARRLLPEHSCKFSRHDFTLAQLFACLVVREFFDLSYRRAEAQLLTVRHRPLAIDSTCFEQRHRSMHYDRRCRRMNDDASKRPGKWGKTV